MSAQFKGSLREKTDPAKLLKSSRDEDWKRRSFLHVTLLHIGIRIQYLIDSWFFLKPLFAKSNSAYTSPYRPKDIPEIDYPTIFALRLLFIIGGILHGVQPLLFIMIKLGAMDLMNKWYVRLLQRVARIMRESGVDWENKRNMPIPEYDWKNGNPKEFYETFVKRPHPVILRGFMKDTNLIKEFSFDKILEKYGEESVLVSTVEDDSILGKVKDTNNPKVYLFASEVLFKKYPEFWDSLQTENLEPYTNRTLKAGWAQFFMGRQGTGSPFHMASAINWFFMIDGTKKWYFIDPTDMYWAGPFWLWGAAAALFVNLYPEDYDESVFPAFKYCPYFSTDVHAGDVLYNPAWWPHAIRNVSDKTVAVASRWVADGAIGSNLRSPEEDYDINRLASFLFMSGPKSYPFLQEILYEPSPSYDEHSTMREKNVRFTEFQYKLSKGQFVRFGWRPIF